MLPGGPVALATQRRSLGLGMFVVLDRRSGELRHAKHLRSTEGGQQRRCYSTVLSCFLVLAATKACA